MDTELLIENVHQSVTEVITEFSNNPADFLYEADLQCLLYTSLRRRFSPYPIPPQAKELEKLFGYRPLLNPVKSEFPYNVDGLSAKFDVAILDHQQDPLRRIWWQPCRFGIELKLWQPDGTGNNIFSDLKKLKAYGEIAKSRGKEFSGLALLFVHPGAEERLANLQTTIAPAISANEISLHVVTRTNWRGVIV